MEKSVQTSNYGTVKLSNNEIDIIDLIRRLRNDLIKDFLDERHLKRYLEIHYHIKEVSPIKLEFMRKALKELLISPVDTDHYKPLMDEIKNNERTSLAEGNEMLFYKEIESIFHRFAF
jgi:signal transduction histidine kinase